MTEVFICPVERVKIVFANCFTQLKEKHFMRKLTAGILLGLWTLTSLAQAENNRYHPNHLFIKMKTGESLIQSPLIQSSKQIFSGLYLVKTADADKLAAEISQAAEIEYIQKDFYASTRSMPKHEVLNEGGLLMKRLVDFDFTNSFNDPEVGKLWAFSEKSGLDVLGAYDSLPTHSPEEVIVAVVDTGVDHNHEDLKDVMWVNHAEIPGNGIDDDNNGYIDDIHGINTLVRDSQGRATMNTMASHWHGTHVAGTIAATQNNGIGIAGVTSNVKIMAIRTVPDNADELDSDIVEGFLYAAKMGAKVINCSFGKKENEGGMVVRDTINQISQNGVLVVVSAGNDSFGPFSWANNDVNAKYPASFDSANMLVIASTASNGRLSSFSNIGPKSVHVASPGSNIYSTINGNKYSMASGTSMAAPNAAGVAAMVMGYYPNLKNTTVKKVLMNTTTKVSSFEGKIVSGGRLNLKAALEKAKTLKR
jgi:subtilisin family serine protease